MTPEGALAMIGNFGAEAGPNLDPRAVEIGRSKLSNEQYVAAVDNGLYEFVDGIGFGLAQWTDSKRKRKLLAYAKANGSSIADGEMQCRFAVKELKEDFHTVWIDLCSSHDLFQLTQLVCNHYEIPANKNVGTRYEYAQRYQAEIKNKKPAPTDAPFFKPDITVMAIQALMCGNGYDIPITGYKTKEFFAKLREFVDDMEGC